jgi:hypothetical protein
MTILRVLNEFRSIYTVKGFNFFSIAMAVALIAVVVSSCAPKDRRPAGILSKEQMTRVLCEVYINEEKVTRLNLRRDSAEAVAEIFDVKAFEKLQTSDSVFRLSFNYYMDRPAEMEQIYTAVVDSLQLREQIAPAQ